MVGAFAQASGKLAAPEAVIAMFGGTSVVELAREVQHELRATIFTICPRWRSSSRAGPTATVI